MKRWPNKPLGEVCSINPKLMGSDVPGPNAEVAFVPMAAVDEVSGTIARPERRQYSEVAKGYTPFMTNDVLFAKITPCMQNGKAAVVSDLCGGVGFGSTEFHVLRSAGNVLPRWVFAFIRQPAFRSAAESSFTGSAGQQRVPADFLKTFPIPVPPLAEQERLVKLLDEADELRKLRTQADRRTTDLIPSIFHEMFGDSFTSPKGCSVVRIDEAGRVQLGRQRAPKYQTGKFTRPYIRVANVYEDEIDVSDLLTMDFDERDFLQYRLEEGDILLNEGQSTELVGRPAMWRNEIVGCCFQNTLVRFQPDRKRVLPDFALAVFLAYFRGGNFANISSKTSNVAHLGAARFAKMPFPLPPLPQQKEFASRVSEIRAMQSEQAASRRRLDDLFQSMLHRAFQGDL